MMFHAIETVATLPDYQLFVLFRSGESKVYDMSDLMARHEAFSLFALHTGFSSRRK